MQQYILIALCALMSVIQIFSTEPIREIHGGITKLTTDEGVEYSSMFNLDRASYHTDTKQYHAENRGHKLDQPKEVFGRYQTQWTKAKANDDMKEKQANSIL